MDLMKMMASAPSAVAEIVENMLMVKSYDTGRAQITLVVNDAVVCTAVADDDEQEALLESIWPRRGGKAWFVGDASGMQGKAYITVDYASLFGADAATTIPKMLQNGFWNPGKTADVLAFNPRQDPKERAASVQDVLARLKESQAKVETTRPAGARTGRGWSM